MPTIGPYETAERLFLSGVGGIYTLKSDAGKVIKILHPPVGIWTDERIGEEIDGFRLRAKIQKKLAGQSRNWAPVHASAAIRDSETAPGGDGSRVDSSTGETTGRPVADGAYAVMDRYERSVQSLLDGRVMIHNADLRAIFSGVVQGLIDLKKQVNRPHGALKASNILLKNSNDLPSATVHLSDPAPDGALTAKSEAQDFDSLARLLFHLVNRRPYDEGTISRNKAWDAIGPNGEDWRKLCDHLMNPQAAPEERDLEKLLPRIATWTAKPRRSKKPLLAAVVLVLLISGGVWGYFWFRGPPFKSEEWQQESLTYRAWYGQFVEEMDKDQNKNDPALKEFADALGNSDLYTPNEIAGNRSLDDHKAWDALIADPPPPVQKAPGPANTKKALALIKDVSGRIQNSAALRTIDDAAKDYSDAKGWKKAAEVLDEISKSAHPPALQENGDIDQRIAQAKKLDESNAGHELVIGLKQAAAAAAEVRQINSAWHDIDTLIQGLKTDVEIPRLTELRDFVQKMPNDPPPGSSTGDVLKDLQNSLVGAKKFASDMADFLNQHKGGIDYAALAADPRASKIELNQLTMADYDQLKGAFSDYVKIPDARPAFVAAWKKFDQGTSAGDLTESIKLLQDVQKSQAADGKTEDARATGELITEFRDQESAIASDIATLNGYSPIHRDEEKISLLLGKPNAPAANPAQTLYRRMEGLSADARKFTDPYRETPEQFLARHAKDPASGDPIGARAKAAHDAYLAELKGNGEFLKDFNNRVAADKKFLAIKAAYDTIAAALPQRRLSGLPAFPWAAAIAKHVTDDLHQTAIDKILHELEQHKLAGVPDPANAAYTQFVKDTLATYNTRCDDAGRLIKDFTDLGSQLDDLQLLPADPGGGMNWSKLYDAWLGSQPPPLIDADIRNALQDITARVTNLRATEKETSYDRLLETLQDKNAAPELVLVAWQRLDAVTPPADAPVLQNELDAQTAIKARLNADALLPAPRRSTLIAVIDAAGPARWHKWADGLSDPKKIATAVDLAEKLGVLKPGAQFSRTDAPAWYYYQRLVKLQKLMTSGANVDALKAEASSFRDDLEGKSGPALNIPRESIAPLLKDLDEALNEGQGSGGSEQQGPELAGWTLDKQNPDDNVRTFTKDGKTLVFRKISLSEDGQQKIIYLCTTEMSLGVFVSVMNDDIVKTGRVSQINTQSFLGFQLDDVSKDHYTKGARGWMWTGQAFAINPPWIDTINEWPTALANAKASAYPPNVAAPVATDKSPLQYVSPRMAMFTANLLGCRLPTSREWTTAYQQFESKALNPNLPPDVWNLRGTSATGLSWKGLQDYDLNTLFKTPLLLDADRLCSAENSFVQDRLNAPIEQLLGEKADGWMVDNLRKIDDIAANRITPAPGMYAHNTLWFRNIDEDGLAPGAPDLPMHNLVGNVGEYVFDGAGITEPIKTAVTPQSPTVKQVQDTIGADRNKNMFVIGGSSLSPPNVSFTAPQKVDVTAPRSTFTDVGFRLAYTAPKKTIDQVLREYLADGKLPGPAIPK